MQGYHAFLIKNIILKHHKHIAYGVSGEGFVEML